MKVKAFSGKKLIWTMLIGLGAAAVMVVVSSLVGSSGMSVSTAVRILLSKIPLVGPLISTEDISASQNIIVLQLRLPRALGALLVGGGLAVCGAALQGMFKNPLADTGLLGISSGAALGAGIAVILGLQKTAFGLSGVSVFAFVGGISCILLVYYLARVKGRIHTVSLLLSGTAMSTFAAAVLSLLMMLHHEQMAAIYSWTMGSLTNIGWKQLSWCVLPILAGTALLLVQARELNLLLLGEEEARHLGVNINRVKLRIMLLTALISAAAVSVSGVIGFVGLMVPHVVRLISGPDHRYLLPVSFVAGGIYLLLVDMVAKTIAAPLEMPIGVITSVLGGPFFIYLLRKKGVR